MRLVGSDSAVGPLVMCSGCGELSPERLVSEITIGGIPSGRFCSECLNDFMRGVCEVMGGHFDLRPADTGPAS